MEMETPTPQIFCGIALYLQDEHGDNPYFHWGFVIADNHEFTGSVSLFEIVHDTYSSQSGWSWRDNFRPANLHSSGTFRGVVELFSFDAEGKDMIIEEINAQGVHADPKFVIQRPIGWTCATWTLKVVLRLADIGFWFLPPGVTRDTIYDRVLQKGYLIRELFGHRQDMREFPVLELVRSLSDRYTAHLADNCISETELVEAQCIRIAIASFLYRSSQT